MFALKIVFTNFKKLDVSCEYMKSVISKEKEMNAMLLATKDITERNTEFIISDEVLIEETKISHKESPLIFSKEL